MKYKNIEDQFIYFTIFNLLTVSITTKKKIYFLNYNNCILYVYVYNQYKELDSYNNLSVYNIILREISCYYIKTK